MSLNMPRASYSFQTAIDLDRAAFRFRAAARAPLLADQADCDDVGTGGKPIEAHLGFLEADGKKIALGNRRKWRSLPKRAKLRSPEGTKTPTP
jgi:hypothetical protein